MINLYKKIKNNIKFDYDFYDYLEDFNIFVLYGNVVNNDSANEKSFNKFFEIFFPQNLDKEYCYIVSQFIDKFCYINETTSKMTSLDLLKNFELIYDLNYDHSFKFLPYLFELIKRKDEDLYNYFKPILYFIILNYDFVKKYVYDKTNFKIENYDFNTKLLNYIKEYYFSMIDNGCSLTDFSYVITYFLNKTNFEQLIHDMIAFQSIVIKSNNFSSIFDNASDNTKRNYNIYLQRFDSADNFGLTLEEVGSKAGITRERVRQIITKFGEKLKNKIVNQKYDFFINLFYDIKNNNLYPYLTLKDIKNYLISNNDDDFINFIISIYSSNLVNHLYYDDKIKIIYDKRILSITDITEDILKKYPISILKEDIKLKSNRLLLNIINNFYNEKELCYIRKGVSKKSAIEYIIKRDFSDGINVKELQYTDDTYKLLKIMKNEFGIVHDGEPRSLFTIINRCNCINIDRSAMIHRSFVTEIDKELINEIINFIDLNKPIVQYENILQNFKTKLMYYGIDNRYFLKSMIDNKIPKSLYKCGRDSISSLNCDLSFNQFIVNKINEYEGPFTIDDLKQAFPYSENYIFSSIIMNMDNIIQIDEHKYVNLKYLNYNILDVLFLENEIDQLFNKLNVNVISSRKLFTILSIKNSEFIDKLNYIDDSFALFSFLNKLLGDKYYMRRPLIAKNEKDLMTSKQFILSHFRQLESFNLVDIKNYIEKHKIGFIYSTIGIIDDLSDDFVLVDRDKMIRKDILNLNNDFLNKFINVIKSYLNMFLEIDTRKFKGYSLLPKIRGKWNKYFLIGIIKAYFNSKFKVIATDAIYLQSDFIIKEASNYE